MAKKWWESLSTTMKNILADQYFQMSADKLSSKQIIYIHYMEMEN